MLIKNQAAYIFVDLENIKPNEIGNLLNNDVGVLLFVGANQKSLSVDIVLAMQQLAESRSANYIQITGNGRNALDFHITYYLGLIASKHPASKFYIFSNDKGYDPLIQHLQERKINVKRINNLNDVLHTNNNGAAENIDYVGILKKIVSLQAKKPRKSTTLANAIKSMSKNTITTGEASAYVSRLANDKLIEIKSSAVTYNLPKIKKYLSLHPST